MLREKLIGTLLLLLRNKSLQETVQLHAKMLWILRFLLLSLSLQETVQPMVMIMIAAPMKHLKAVFRHPLKR